MKKIKKGDEVIVITGKDKGKKGSVLSVIRKKAKKGQKEQDLLLVDNVNLVKKHVKANPNTGDRGGIVAKPMPIHRSNVMVFDPSQNKGSRVGIRELKDGQRVRFLKASDQLVEANT